jgi:peptide deformylase
MLLMTSAFGLAYGLDANRRGTEMNEGNGTHAKVPFFEDEVNVVPAKRILKFNSQEDIENLRRPSVEVTAFDDILKRWAEELIATAKVNRCYGVAAPQIGINIRMICIEGKMIDTDGREQKDGMQVYINPVIVEATGRMKFEEMCLSFPGYAVKTRRKARVKFKYQTVDGEEREAIAVGVQAICVQHEVEHLDGILLTDNGQLYKVK